VLLVFAFSLSWAWCVIGMKVQTPETVMQISMTFLFPLTFASNVFVDPATMPGWVQSFVQANPITHLTNTARGLMNGGLVVSNVGWVLLWSLGLLVVFAPLTMRIYNSER
jgi:ABC-2 type transport system permease protein